MSPKVIIENEVYRKIMYWVNKSSHEVSGLGMVSIDESGIFRVTHAMLLPQENTGTSTDIEADAAADMMYKCRHLPGDLRFWWHSHVDMDVFWSGTDMKTMRELGAAGWFLSTVFNKKREIRSAYLAAQGSSTPWGQSELFLDSLPTTILPFVEVNAQQWDTEYTENVKAKVYDTTRFQYGAQLGNSRILPVTHGLLKRPKGMSKKLWRESQQKASLPPVDETDAYGFTREERAFLASQGWDDADIDTLFQEDISPQDPGHTIQMVACHWSVEEIMTQQNFSGARGYV